MRRQQISLAVCLVVLSIGGGLIAEDERQRNDLFDSGFATLSREMSSRSKTEEPLVIAWVIDESASLNGTRKRLAKRIDQLAKSLNRGSEVKSLVVGVSEEVHVLTESPVTIARTSQIVATLESNPSGKENLFAGVSKAVELLAKSKTSERHVVIVADERGDDSDRVADIAAACKEQKVRVFCLGSIAPFGKQQGSVNYVYQDGFAARVAVDQGPESFRFQALQLPPLNEDMPQLSSGFGPYALSLLCRETSGRFVPIQDAADVFFDGAVLSKYEPDYRTGLLSRQAVSKEFRKHPLRVAVIAASEKTAAAKDRYREALRRTFRATSQNSLRTELTNCQRHVAVITFAAREAVQTLEAAEERRPSETNLRWQAAYDLALGQALATQVRCLTLNYELAQMKVKAELPTEPRNTWSLEAAGILDPSEKILKDRDRATGLLRRVEKEHKGTPFAAAAAIYLKHGFGWTWTSSEVEYPPEVKKDRGRKFGRPRPLIIRKTRSARRSQF